MNKLNIVTCIIACVLLMGACREPVADLTPPSDVTDLTTTASNKAVTLNWVSPADPDFSHVEIWYGTEGIPYIPYGSFKNGPARIIYLENGTDYTFRVKAVDSSGNASAGEACQCTPIGGIESVKLVSSDGAAADWFGASVSISGDFVVVGAPWDDDNGTTSGSAYIFGRDQGGPDTWGQIAKLTASDGAGSDTFGCTVSISGDYAVVGAERDDDNGESSGSAYVFSRDHGGADKWGEIAKLTASDGAENDWFGCSVCIFGDYIVIGAYYDDDNGVDSGSAYVFSRNEGGPDNWGEIAKLTPATDGGAYDNFGCSVGISGDCVIVGAEDNGYGCAYLFERNSGGADNWGEITRLTASDGGIQDQFGCAVSIYIDNVIVGAVAEDANGDDSGSAYIFGRDVGGADNWGEVCKLTASDGATFDAFGCSVSISGDAAIVGALGDADKGSQTGSAYVYGRYEGGLDTWGEVEKIIASDSKAGDRFGASVGISGDFAIVGCTNHSDPNDGLEAACILNH